MILKKKTFLKKNNNFLKSFLIFYFFLTLFIAVLFFIFFSTSYTVKLKTSKVLDYLSKSGRMNYIHLPEIVFKSVKSNFYKIDKIDLEIRFNDIVTLENERKIAIENNSLGIKDNLTKVKAIISHKNKKIDAEIRLKGNRKIHFVKKKHSSYNVYLPENEYIFGVKNFSIQKPGVRNYIHEWIFNEMIGDLGLIKSKYKFFDLYINGDNQGLYVFEEKMGKEIIERNKRRNGPIFSTESFHRPNENLIFQIYNEKYWNKDQNIELARIARQKLSDFLNGKSNLKETFDIEKFAAFFAVIDATYTAHALFFNSKMFYNPVSGLFEPIPRDGHRQLPNYSKFNNNYYDRIIIDSIFKPETFEELGGNLQIPEGRQWWINKFFLNKNNELNREFYELYKKYLEKISSEEYLKSFLKKRNKEIDKINSHIYSDYFFYSTSRGYSWGLYYFDEKDLFYRAKVIQKRLDVTGKKISAIIENENTLVIDLVYPYTNYRYRKEKLDSLKVQSINCNGPNNEIFDFSLNKNLNVFSNTKINLEFLNNKKIICNYIKIVNYDTNQNFLVKIDKLNSDIKFDNFKIDNSKRFTNYFVEKNNQLFLRSNEISIDEDLYIPENKMVILKDGQIINLKNNAFIISESAWSVNGKENSPVLIQGEIENFGGGILIADKYKTSFFNNVKFSYLGGYKFDYFDKKSKRRYETITSYSSDKTNEYKEKIFEKNLDDLNSEFIILGALNFHQTKLNLSNVSFNKIASEDSINIINSNFIMNDVEFEEISSDSIDLDFSDGVIKNATFKNIGNDAIDFSGSNVSVKNIYFDNVNDKLISVGENSKINVSKINAKKSYTGIAAKDGSIVKASNINMTKVKLPFVSYNKKFEYDKAYMHLENINVSEFSEKWVTDGNSKIYFNNDEVGFASSKIIPIIYKKDLNLLKKIN